MRQHPQLDSFCEGRSSPKYASHMPCPQHQTSASLCPVLFYTLRIHQPDETSQQPYFADEKTETQRDLVTRPRLFSQWVVELGLKSGQDAPKPHSSLQVQEHQERKHLAFPAPSRYQRLLCSRPQPTYRCVSALAIGSLDLSRAAMCRGTGHVLWYIVRVKGGAESQSALCLARHVPRVRAASPCQEKPFPRYAQRLHMDHQMALGWTLQGNSGFSINFYFYFLKKSKLQGNSWHS